MSSSAGLLVTSVLCLIYTAQGAQGNGAKAKPSGSAISAQSPSSFSYGPSPDGSKNVEIRNVTYEYTGTGIPGRPTDERLLLRKTVHSKASIDDIGVDASVTLEAWPLGADLKQKPLYSLNVAGTGGRTLYPDLFVADRGLEEVDWWSVYKLGTGQFLFDSYVPLVSFSIRRDVLTTRYAGLEVPPDDVKDARLKEPRVVAVVIYASPDRVVREALLTCDDVKRAQLLRSFSDSTRTLTELEDEVSGPQKRGVEPRRSLKLSIVQNYPSPPAPVDIVIPIQGDDLDLPHASLPAGLHLAAWRR